MAEKADVIIVGAGLAGLVAARELILRGKNVIILDQEGEQSLGGQACWSVGGLFMVDTPEQRRLGIKDSYALALQDWMGTAQFNRPEDYWPRKWAEAYINFASGQKQSWLRDLGVTWLTLVGWAERGGGLAHGHGNSVPRFHMTWGLGPALLEPFINFAQEAAIAGKLKFVFRHRVTRLNKTNGIITGVTGDQLKPCNLPRGQKSNQEIIGHFEIKSDAVIVCSGGIGGNIDLVRKHWPVEELGRVPEHIILGVPHHVDGKMIEVTSKAGGKVINSDRMWHYADGLRNSSPVWPEHGIRVLAGPSSLWFDALGNRLPAPNFPGFDNRSSLKHIASTDYDYSWLILTEKIIKKEFALSGSEQNPDLASRSTLKLLYSRITGKSFAPVQTLIDNGTDFIVRNTLEDLVTAMNKLSGKALIDLKHIQMQIEARDRQVENPFSKDAQIHALHETRAFVGDRRFRTAKPHAFLDKKAGPLIAVRLNIMTRKTLGGINTDLEGKVLGSDGNPVPGLYAAGESSGFGGGGYHGNNALEGTFLGGCLFSGHLAGQSALA